jgi:hypothetical protein
MRSTNTEQFTLTIGLFPGYVPDHSWPTHEANLRAAAPTWHRLLTEEGERSGIYPSAVVQPGVAVYRNEADDRGEPIAVIFGTRNPKHAPDAEAWKHAVLRVVGGMKRALRQVTCQVVFTDVELTYFEADDR